METIESLLAEIKEELTEIKGASAIANKQYLTPQDVEDYYSFKKSLQAKLRMDKDYGPPYVRPSGARIVLYNKDEFEQWLLEWKVEPNNLLK